MNKNKKPDLSDEFKFILKLSKHIPAPETEYMFHPTRKWRFDFAWPEKKIAVECDGIIWKAGGGRHNMDSDRDKINNAVIMGWKVLRFSGAQIRLTPMECLEFIERLLNDRNE